MQHRNCRADAIAIDSIYFSGRNWIERSDAKPKQNKREKPPENVM